jgi:hypothetical protein
MRGRKKKLENQTIEKEASDYSKLENGSNDMDFKSKMIGRQHIDSDSSKSNTPVNSPTKRNSQFNEKSNEHSSKKKSQENIQSEIVAESLPISATPNKRGRKKKSTNTESSASVSKKQLAAKKATQRKRKTTQKNSKRAKRKRSSNQDDSADEQTDESNDEDSKDKDFVLEDDKESEDEQDDEYDDDDDQDYENETSRARKSVRKSDENESTKPTISKKVLETLKENGILVDEEASNNLRITLNRFDLNAKVTEWRYELDNETQFYCKPILPMLSDDALIELRSPLSKPPICIIYECPYCGKRYTYTVVFKSHLYMCEENKNIPKYILICAHYPECDFKGSRKQEMVNHYIKQHSFSKNETSDLNSSKSSLQCEMRLTAAKKTQFQLNSYTYLDKRKYTFTVDYHNMLVANRCKRLSKLDEFCLPPTKSLASSFYSHHQLKIIDEHTKVKNSPYIEFDSIQSTLSFKLFCSNETDSDINRRSEIVKLMPFEIVTHNSPKGPFKLFNVVNQVTALDWCPVSSSSQNKITDQFMAFSVLPFNNLNKLNSANNESSNIKIKCDEFNNMPRLANLLKMPNLIFICKFSNMFSQTDENIDIYCLYSAEIGRVCCLKWRPDFGSSFMQTNVNKEAKIGYLLATGSNGNGYILNVQDMSYNCSQNKKSEDQIMNNKLKLSSLNVFKSKRQVVLKVPFSFGQCTSGDWSQLNGATRIALGYFNGAIALFEITNQIIENCFKLEAISSNADSKELSIYPTRTFNAHQTFVKAIKWSKLNEFVLSSGCMFSREIK